MLGSCSVGCSRGLALVLFFACRDKWDGGRIGCQLRQISSARSSHLLVFWEFFVWLFAYLLLLQKGLAPVGVAVDICE